MVAKMDVGLNKIIAGQTAPILQMKQLRPKCYISLPKVTHLAFPRAGA